MSRLTKAELNDRILKAVESAGWSVTVLADPDANALRFDMERGDARRRVRAHIWNLTHGGGRRRPDNERRIQITGGIGAFEAEPGGITVILGWSPDPAVFAAFDIDHHSEPLGRSPSMQIGAEALIKAAEKGIAQQKKRKGEIAIAVRPDLLASYLARSEAAHAGDLDAVIAPTAPQAEAQVERDFEYLAATVAEDAIGSDREMEERRRVLERLDVLEREISSLQVGAAPIGHNNPPEPIEQVRSDADAEITEAAGRISAELREPRPDVRSVARAATRLQRIRTEAREMAAKVVEKGREKVAETVTGIVVAGAVLLGRTVLDALGFVLDHLHAWFLALGG